MTTVTDIGRALGGKPNGRGGYRCKCPAHDDSDPSLDVDMGRNGLPVFVCRANCSQADIMAALARRGIRWTPEETDTRSHSEGPPRHGKFGPAHRTYRYTDAAGGLAGVVCRWDTPEGKQILPAVPDGRGWKWGAMPEPRPLYRLADLLARPDAQVLIVEGEKCADAAAKAIPELVAISWPGGGKAVSRADWSPLTGRRAVLWPDNDIPGDNAMAQLAGILAKAGATSIRVMRRDPDKPKGWDIADAIADGMTAGALVDYARRHAEEWPSGLAPSQSTPLPPRPSNVIQLRTVRQETPDPDTAVAPEFSDDYLALEFSRRHGDGLRYVAAWGKWFRWTGSLWRDEQTLLAWDMAREICREAATALDTIGGSGAKGVAASKTVAAVVNLARADRRHAATTDDWDRDPWLLNTPGGTIDLRSGENVGHRQADHITKQTGVAPDHAMPTPVWDAFLDRITQGDRALVGFLQRIAGYSLTGDTREHALFFLYGLGANGKSTFLNAIQGCVGDYAKQAPIETFTETRNERHPTELAGLRGSRLVTATETEEGRRWAESRIKALTGGDRIAARFMRQDFFEYTPQFKLLIAGNHKPGLKSVDEAIRRRFHLIPFTASIPPHERDPDLGRKLQAEWPGILAWMIDGCAEWQERGLSPPESVSAATDEYLDAEDALSAWIDDRCERRGECMASDLFASWKDWADKAGEFAGSLKRFSQTLQSRGFTPRRTARGISYAGIVVRARGDDLGYNAPFDHGM